MDIKNLKHAPLDIASFSTSPGQSWCIYGSNNSGIELLFSILAGEVHAAAEKINIPARQGIISFKVQQELYEDEIRNDDSDFLDRIDPGTAAVAFLPPGSDQSPLIQAFAMTDSLEKGYRQLSSGQSRRLILLKEILNGTNDLLIQNPYDGLDETGCRELDSALSALEQHGVQLLVTVTNRSDIPDWCSHLAILQHGRMVLQGRREEVIAQTNTIHEEKDVLFRQDINQLAATTAPQQRTATTLVELKNGFARFGDRLLFSHLDLRINTGCHTLITGPNGCGKSTLLHIITGDNPNCYANNLHIFGIQRGSGESIWDLKRDMGIVTPDLHRNYRAAGTAKQVVLSGLFDTIGLYRQVTKIQENTAMQWLEWINLANKAKQSFRNLNFAEQRLVLIVRALIKLPKLLILDEPTQGLDEHNRKRLLDFLEEVATTYGSTIIYVSHRKDEQRPFFRQHIKLDTYNP